MPRTFMCEPRGRREIFLTFSLLVEIQGHVTNEFVSYVYETEDRIILFTERGEFLTSASCLQTSKF
jgi:hypothetical protein